MPNDNPETLVKYCNSNTAEKILSSQSLRWSAPHLFADPFELNHESGLNFDPHALLLASIKMSTAMIFAKESPKGNTPLVNAIRRWREEERFASPDEAEVVLKDLLSQLVDQRQLSIDAIMADWRKFTRNLRISCFCAKPDNLAAWSLHGDNHKGIAIRFRCGEYTGLQDPKPVIYQSSRPEITTLKEQISVIMYRDSFTAQKHFYDKFTFKPPVFTPIQEWRCFRKSTETNASSVKNDSNEVGSTKADSQWYDDIKFEKSDVISVYFGIHTEPEIKRALYDLIKEKYNQAQIFQSTAAVNKYEMTLERLPAANK